MSAREHAGRGEGCPRLDCSPFGLHLTTLTAAVCLLSVARNSARGGGAACGAECDVDADDGPPVDEEASGMLGWINQS